MQDKPPFNKDHSFLPEDLDPRVKKILQHFTETAFTIEAPEQINDKPIYETTLYLATCKNLEMQCGTFTAYVFQDIIHKGYIVALAYGDIFNTKSFYTRIHSSCLTSETLQACDCDCSEQLLKALDIIVKNKVGIFFYLMQEGRGVGYIAKARDRMLVQAANDEISTFEAYKLLGLRRDYRQYRNILPICKMLKIDPEFILLTNNPNKVDALKRLGLKIKHTEPLESQPSPYNLAYLSSKMEAGHTLKHPLSANFSRVRPPKPVIPFKPHTFDDEKRFILVASYYLPIRPVDDEIILSSEQFQNYFQHISIDDLIHSKNPIILNYQKIRNNRFKVKLNEENFLDYNNKHPQSPLNNLLNLPYWFQIFVYFDIMNNEEQILLTYGTEQTQDIPIVRIQDESLFNRFPLIDTYFKNNYQKAVKEIVDYGMGIILLLNADTRGIGFGAYAQNMMLKQAGIPLQTSKLFIPFDINYNLKDHEGAMAILKRHINNHEIQMILDAPSSIAKKAIYAEILHALHIEVQNWIFLKE